ncbi:MAG: HAD family hydrolase [Bacteroidales bacterium]
MAMNFNLNNISNIIFDLGGVILNIDPQRTIEEMGKLGIKDFDRIYSQIKQNHVFDDLEKGLISEREFVEAVQEYSGIKADPEDIIHCWNCLLLDFPPQRIELLQNLKKSERYNTYLLSNTNETHKKVYNQMLRDQFGIDGLEALFNKAYFSHEIHMRKPDREIFEYVLRDSNMDPEKTLFIDDSEVNTQAAQKLGIKTYLVDSDNSITALFSQR